MIRHRNLNPTPPSSFPTLKGLTLNRMRKTRYQTKVRETDIRSSSFQWKFQLTNICFQEDWAWSQPWAEERKEVSSGRQEEKRNFWLHSSAFSIRSCLEWETTVSSNRRIMNTLILPVNKDSWKTEMKQHPKRFDFVTVCDFPERCQFKVSLLQCNSHSEALRLEQQRCQVCFHHLNWITSLWFLTSGLDPKLAVSMTLPDNLAPFPYDFFSLGKMFFNFFLKEPPKGK